MKLYFKKLGTGPSMVILHGLYGSSDNWMSIARSISNRFTVILPDQRNHGLSPESDIHDYNSLSDDLKELADDLNLGKFFLAGHSMGGKTAINFALRWPERLNGLLIADISPLKNEKLNTEAEKLHLSILGTVLSLNLAEITSRKDAESQLSIRLHDERIRGLIMKNLHRNPDGTFRWKINARSLLTNLDKIMEGIEPKRTGNLHITGFPVFFLKGEESDYLPEKDFSEISLIFPAAEFIRIPGAGHWLHSENPDAVKKSLLRFLDNL